LKYPEVYEFWKENWKETFKVLEGKDKINSDDYLRGDRVVVITYNDVPVSMAIMNSFLMDQDLYGDLKYFNYYPGEVVDQLKKKYRTLQACTYLTVHKDYRKTSSSFEIAVPLSELIFAVCVYLTKESGDGGMLGVSRRDMGMTKMTKRYGATVCGITQAHNVVVDLICVDRESRIFNPLALDIIESELIPDRQKRKTAA
jgi:hypothetical protein